MVVGLPVSVSMPSWLSAEQAIGAVGCAGGLLFSDYVAATIISASGQTGAAALGVGALSKAALGFGLFYMAGKTRGGAATALGLAAIGCTASIAIDVFRYVWPAVGVAGARVAAATRGARIAAPIRVGPAVVGAPAGIRIRAETPSGMALGGF